jgi:hypothetical protein
VRKKEIKLQSPPPTGWNNGLLQDYDRGLANWFSSRLDAMAVLRRWFGNQTAKSKS